MQASEQAAEDTEDQQPPAAAKGKARPSQRQSRSPSLALRLIHSDKGRQRRKNQWGLHGMAPAGSIAMVATGVSLLSTPTAATERSALVKTDASFAKALSLIEQGR